MKNKVHYFHYNEVHLASALEVSYFRLSSDARVCLTDNEIYVKKMKANMYENSHSISLINIF